MEWGILRSITSSDTSGRSWSLESVRRPIHACLSFGPTLTLPPERLAPVSKEMILNYISQKVLDLPKSY